MNVEKLLELLHRGASDGEIKLWFSGTECRQLLIGLSGGGVSTILSAEQRLDKKIEDLRAQLEARLDHLSGCDDACTRTHQRSNQRISQLEVHVADHEQSIGNLEKATEALRDEAKNSTQRQIDYIVERIEKLEERPESSLRVTNLEVLFQEQGRRIEKLENAKAPPDEVRLRSLEARALNHDRASAMHWEHISNHADQLHTLNSWRKALKDA